MQDTHFLRVGGLGFLVDEVAAFSVHADQFSGETSTFLRFVFGVDLVVFAEFLRSVGELALPAVGAATVLHEFLAELRFDLVRTWLAGAAVGVDGFAGGALFLGAGGVVGGVGAAEWSSSLHYWYLAKNVY